MPDNVYTTLPSNLIDPATGKLKLKDWTNVKGTLSKVQDGDTVWVTIQTESGPYNIDVRAGAINAPEDGPGYTQSDGFDAGAKPRSTPRIILTAPGL